MVPTGVAIALPDGYAAFVHPRSGLAAKHGVTIVNAPGTVDAGYRGEIRVTLLNTDAASPSSSSAATGSRSWSSSAWSAPVFHEVDALPGSARGDGGFGSTGGHASAQAGRCRRTRITASRPGSQVRERQGKRKERGVPSAAPRGSGRARGREDEASAGLPESDDEDGLGRARGR